MRKVAQRHRPALLLDGVCRAAFDLADPSCEEKRVGHGRGEAHDGDARWEQDDTLFPSRAALQIAQEVHLVEDCHPKVLDKLNVSVQQAAENLGGDHEDGAARGDAVVARDEAHLAGKLRMEIGEHLVAERLDGRAEDGVARAPQGQLQRQQRHRRLPRGRRRGNDDALRAQQRLAGPPLVLVQRVAQAELLVVAVAGLDGHAVGVHGRASKPEPQPLAARPEFGPHDAVHQVWPVDLAMDAHRGFLQLCQRPPQIGCHRRRRSPDRLRKPRLHNIR
mmetsp:Transcript_59429/g.192148  ORF Transcript_59429/g.192148 Transcript_59429/m.192148 type:complete len:277 (+) Transcript_59429:2942-3772(+)